MVSLIFRRNSLVLTILLALTGLSWLLAHKQFDVNLETAAIVVLLVAAFKVRLVMQEFMEIRHAPAVLRLFADAWVAAVTLVIGFFFWQSGAAPPS